MSWKFVDRHVVHYDDKIVTFSVCRQCLSSLRMAEKIPYYRKITIENVAPTGPSAATDCGSKGVRP